ncbi:MAG: hypothetical protein UR28_C0020G0006 [Candidatus Peregrinibacteria bacterium GW2011_GWF2_33_10]|nr:MAG: hypothetical protein UR28_C0020G0006 [Candidatus Peregrinibacteria bacterium GW2011_GWF2_33_10]
MEKEKVKPDLIKKVFALLLSIDSKKEQIKSLKERKSLLAILK